jgi:hypothetical protein
MLMDPAVVHDNNGLRSREWLHLVQKSGNKCIEKFRIEGAFNDVAVYDTVVERQCREDRKPEKRSYCIAGAM